MAGVKKFLEVKKFLGGKRIFRGVKKWVLSKKKGHQKNFAYTFKTEVMTSKNGSI